MRSSRSGRRTDSRQQTARSPVGPRTEDPSRGGEHRRTRITRPLPEATRSRGALRHHHHGQPGRFGRRGAYFRTEVHLPLHRVARGARLHHQRRRRRPPDAADEHLASRSGRRYFRVALRHTATRVCTRSGPAGSGVGIGRIGVVRRPGDVRQLSAPGQCPTVRDAGGVQHPDSGPIRGGGVAGILRHQPDARR